MNKRNIPPPIPPASELRLDARRRAELKAEEQAQKQAAQKAPNNIGPNNIDPKEATQKSGAKAKEFGGPKGLEPTRFGDWEKGGRCIDF